MNSLTPEQELEEIDWVCGLAPMPQHLVELGTVIRRYTHEVIIDPADIKVGFVTEGSIAPVSILTNRIVRLAKPRIEVTVWGEKQ